MKRALSTTLLLVCFSIATESRAESVPRPPVVRFVHLTLPFFGYTVIDSRATASTAIGVSTGVLVSRTWLVDAGVFGSGSDDGALLSAQARFGVTPTLVDSADIEGGWTLNLGPWVGYRYDSRTDSDEGGYNKRKETLHSVTEGVGIDVVRWWPSEVGLSLSLNVGLVLPLSRSEDQAWSAKVPDSHDFHHGLDVRGGIGVAF